MAMVEFSVVISVHNKEPHVERAIRSVFAQSYAPREIVVVDDASTDRSPEIIRDLADDRCKVVRRATAGPGGYRARNRGVRESASHWVAFLDADDEWKPHHLQSLNGAVEGASDSVGCVFAGHVNYFGPRDLGMAAEVVCRPVSKLEQLDFARFVSLWLDMKRCPINASGVAVKRSVLLELGGFPEDRCVRGGDKDLWLRTCAAVDAIAVPEVTSVYYRDSVNMVSDQTSMNRLPCLCHSIAEMLADAEPRQRRLLQRLHNREVLEYAYYTWRKGPIDRLQFREYFVGRGPVGYVLLLAMMAVPGTRLTALRSWLRQVRTMLARARSAASSGSSDA
jgi:glycosyltransferase involved in cell wall biosynthesis